MNTMKRFKLHRLREQIVQDLDVKHIIDSLIVNGAINEEDAGEIRKERERSDQVRHLLDLLLRKDSEAFDCFIESLKKDYDWLYKEFTANISETDSVEENERTFYDAILIGGVPHPPPFNVARERKLHAVRNSLKALQRGKYVVVHGMTGSGKSCLAAAAVYNKELLMGAFKGSIFWLTLGLCDDDELISIMNQFLLRIELNNISPEVSSTRDRAKDELKRRFLKDGLREGLLVLDDVTSSVQIEAFDIGCKILVITKDLEVMRKTSGRYHLIQVNGGFTDSESLSLMAQSINIPMSQLPQQAKSIHILSQGCPMVIALIAGQLEENKDDVKVSNGRWDYYVNLLSEKKFSQFRRDSLFEQDGMLQAISSSVQNLPSEKQTYYWDFALFMDDVNIKPEVLQTLWCFNSKYEVENIMAYFTKKSLAVSKWNEQLLSTVYGIHDLLLHYLKEQLTDTEKKDLHRKLLKRYSDICSNKYAKLPNDNYIYSYIGYHMHQADESTMFSEIFLDLEFIQSKLRVTGPADVLGDFKKYRNQIICENNVLIQELEDLSRFVQIHGLDLYKCEDLDIVQCGLLERKESSVYKKAYKIAKDNPQKLYLECLSDPSPVSFPLTLPLREDIFAACFTNDSKMILIADSSNIIKLWKLDTFEMVNLFRGHLFKVTHLELHPDNQRFLSCSEDGSLKLWNLDYSVMNNRTFVNSAGNNLKVSSPCCLQKSWNSMFLDDSPKDESIKTFSCPENPIITAKFSNSGKEIVSCSKAICMIWECENGNSVISLPSSGFHYTSCAFSNDDSLLFLSGTGFKVIVYSYKNGTLEFIANFSNSSSIISIFDNPIDICKIVTVCQKEIRVWQWTEPGNSENPQTLVKFDKSINVALSMDNISQYVFGEKKNDTNYTCATASRDGKYLVTASSDFIISVWNLNYTVLLAEHKNYSGLARCLDIYRNSDGIPLLLCGSDDRTVKVWHLDQQDTDCSVSLMANFDSLWIRKKSWLPIIASSDSKNRLQVLHGNSYIKESSVENHQITSCVLSDCGGFVYYGCVNGDVKKFDIENGISENIMKLDNEITCLQCYENDKTFLVTAGDSKSLKFWKKDGSISVCYGQKLPVVQTFLVPGSNQILACNQDAAIKIWDIDSGELRQIVIGPSNDAYITCADINEQFNLLVMGDQGACFYMVNFNLSTDIVHVSIESLKSVKIHIFKEPEKMKLQKDMNGVKCCKISPDGLLLALGLLSGCIMIWSLKKRQLLKSLELHISPVQSVVFVSSIKVDFSVPHPCLLVSVGEKIGWWNITNLSNICKCSEKELKYLSNSHSESSLSSSVEIITNEFIDDVDRTIQTLLKKKGSDYKPDLLSCIKLVGSNARKISFSPDFTNFLTVDQSGIIYFLNILL